VPSDRTMSDKEKEESGDEESSEEEIQPPTTRTLPKRDTRGKRMNKLIGDELEKDDMFWGTDHGTWDDDDENAANYYDSGEQDSADSDIDKSSSESEDDGDAQDQALQKKEKQEKAKANKSKNAYMDPAKQRAAPAPAPAPKPKPKPKPPPPPPKPPKPLKTEDDPMEEDIESSEEPEDEKQPKRKVRASTAMRTAEMEEEREWREEQAERAKARREAQKRKKGHKKKKRITQEEILAEAAHTEVINKRFLAKLLQIEEDAKEKKRKKAEKAGPMIRTFSGNGQIFITFTDPRGVPASINSKASPYPKPERCAITDLPAKYRDPKTGLPYANAEAFKKIREQHEKQLATKHTLQAAVATVNV